MTTAAKRASAAKAEAKQALKHLKKAKSLLNGKTIREENLVERIEMAEAMLGGRW